MDFKSVLHALGALLVSIGASLLLPILVSFYYDEGDLLAFITSLFIIVFVGFLMWKFTKPGDIRSREGFAIVTFGWILLAGFGALPFVFTGATNYTDAFFETMSGFTTTGSTILTDVESLSHGLLFWRSFTHWLGGMGIILLSLAILPMLGVGGMQLYKAEVPGPSVDKLKPRVQDTAKILWAVYVILTVAETILLKLGGMNFFDAICHTFGTMATGGFSTKNAGIPYFQSAYIENVLTIFMILAGANFALHYRALKGNFSVYNKNPEFKFYIGIIAAATFFLLLSTRLNNYDSYLTAFQKSIFQVASLMTTTGFHSTDYELWSAPAQLSLLLIMLIGGCAGSTGGGIKVVRILLTLKNIFVQFKKLVHPHAVIPIRLGKTTVSQDAVSDISAFLIIYFLLFAMSSLVMAMLGLDLVTAVSSVISTLSNIGPGIGNIGPTENFAFIPTAGKWYLSFLMLAGRLEILTVLVIFNRSFWVK